MATILQNDWAPVLADEFEKPYYVKLRQTLKEEYQTQTIYPDMYHIFTALHLTEYQNAKVVILGQDPYHGPGQAHGLSFSVRPGIKPPPSLVNIYKELKSDVGFEIPQHGYLNHWAKQGVMMLNTVLTVRQGTPNSHKDIGWETFTDRIIHLLNDRETPLVFILWGKHAQEKAAFIDRNKHFVIASPHPSPFSANRGFFGSRPFSRTNEFLRSRGLQEIDWQLPMHVEEE
ncbi:uracil-DNA glycosylase [Brevibacillus sp. M2.1A]|uniref:uracil-DNA glycosylase n=1 Tax=Brevibacillus TaxID=55080 RepID=UPI00156BA0C2|nr:MULTISPECIES: uracil-DNA glycosylase [Brevibacillus]MBY0084967.1 uracil-DNA glycosylase [Brevibacillus brevis]MCC8433120.1 uracil-DNA glycosylase [Brevibacillus sp. M2.1A]MCE0451180.1 uracil-DNA glycosylase [Brevibacillus sp. AF8]MCM3143572.1 uracil-DNA glycosylase [Brevibacillus sp. MER 51]